MNLLTLDEFIHPYRWRCRRCGACGDAATPGEAAAGSMTVARHDDGCAMDDVHLYSITDGSAAH